MSVVWIDERQHRDPERLRRAHIRAHQARIERRYQTPYQQRAMKRQAGKRRRSMKRELWAMYDAVMWTAVAAIMAMVIISGGN